MYTFKIENGDLAMNGNGKIETVEGSDRIAQQMMCWSLEPLGTDPLYPKFGSSLGTYIGSLSTPTVVADAKSELVRVMNNFAAYESRQLSQSSLGTISSSWTDADVISSFKPVSATSVGGTLSMTVTALTASGQVATTTI